MNITGLKYRLQDDSQVHAFRFPTPTGTRRNLACHVAEPDQVDDAWEALVFALEGNKGPRISHVALQASDGNGDVWLIERSETQTRYTLNGRILEQEADLAFRTALWDHEDIEAETRALAIFRLCPQGGDWYAEPASTRGRTVISARDRWEKQCQDALATAKSLMAAPAEWGLAQVLAFAQSLEPILRQSRDVATAALAMDADGGSPLSVGALEALARMEQEVELGHRIRTVAQPFLDPANSPQVLRDKIQRLDQDLTNLYEKIGPHRDIVAMAADIPWTKVLQVLSKMQAYAMLLEATQEAVTHVDQDLTPLLSDFMSTLDELLERDQTMIQELESCLSTVSLKAQRAAERQAEPPSFSKILDRLRNRTVEPALHNHPKDDGAARELEETRMTIDHALQRLGELHKSLIVAEKVASPGQALKEYHVKVSQEFLKLKALWQQTVNHYHLAEDMTLKGMVALIQHAGSVAALEKERQTLSERLSRYRQELKTLEGLVLDWRQVAQSAKATVLDTPALVMAETRSILQLTGVKEAQLRKLRHDEVAMRMRQNVQSYWQKRQATLDQAWRAAHEQMTIPLRPMTDPLWDMFLRETARLAILAAYRTDPAKALKHDDIFSERSLSHPVSLFLWQERTTENRDRLRLLELIEKAPSYGNGIILASDPVLVDMMASLGVSLSQPVRQAAIHDVERPAEAVNVAVQASSIKKNQNPKNLATKGSQSEIQERARAALRMLTGGKHDFPG